MSEDCSKLVYALNECPLADVTIQAPLKPQLCDTESEKERERERERGREREREREGERERMREGDEGKRDGELLCHYCY